MALRGLFNLRPEPDGPWRPAAQLCLLELPVCSLQLHTRAIESTWRRSKDVGTQGRCSGRLGLWDIHTEGTEDARQVGGHAACPAGNT